MRCSNCGKDIPFTGNVCPYCHANKSNDQVIQAFGVGLGLIGAVIGTWIGAKIGFPETVQPAVIGFFAGMIVGAAAGVTIAIALTTKK